jgi:pyridoxal phosphate enzyme (YggS family)
VNGIAANVADVCRRIEAAARRSGRRATDVTLVAVTKTYPPSTVIEAYRAGLRHFGENRAAEGREKVAGLADWLASQGPEVEGAGPTWHLIGHVQSRQVGDVLGCFQLIHSLDSLKLAQRLQRLADRDSYPPVEVLLQCNVSGEETKSGFDLNRWSADSRQLAEFIKTVRQIAVLDRLVIRGLMTMAPIVNDPEETRPVFRSLAALRDVLRTELPQCDWRHLSMGMTDDFEVAVEEGATMVRIGRAIFGERN